MAVKSVRHQNRHFKTLILLVVSMTGAAFLLSWLDGLATGQSRSALRGMTAQRASWNSVAVRVGSEDAAKGFYHLRIDDNGRLFQSSAWRSGVQHPDSRGTIHVLLSRHDAAYGTAAQSESLQQTVARLCQSNGIGRDAVRVVQ